MAKQTRRVPKNVPTEHIVFCAQGNKKLEPLYIKGSRSGLYWTRTSDPIDVNDVLYQLSQQTTQ